MRLSIIIATRQASSCLERCLRSILAQEFKQWEILIADGASTDGTVELIREYETHIAWWRSTEDEGIYDAWNRALPHARGEYVCFLGADDAWIDAGSLRRLFLAIGAEQYDLVTSRASIFDASTGKAYEHGAPWNYHRIGRRMVVCHPGLLHGRSLFDRYGMFDPRYRIAGDLDFLLRLPPGIRTLHVDTTSVLLQAGGLSRTNVLARLREQRAVLARCRRYGVVRAYLTWIDKLWRLPVARLLKIPH